MKLSILSIIILTSFNIFAEDLFKYNDILSFDIGHFHNCITLKSGKAKCWGDNSSGELGILDDISRGEEKRSIQDLPNVALAKDEQIMQISTGASQTCALLKNKMIKCWGDNEGGMLGQGNDFPRGIHPLSMGKNLPETQLGKNFSPSYVGAGMVHNCALSDKGHVKCWGENAYGQLGLEDTNLRGYFADQMGSNLPIIDFGSDKNGKSLKVKKLSVGYVHNCVIFMDDTSKCWGNNEAGELGLGNTILYGETKNTMGNNLPFLSFNKKYNKKNMIFKSIEAGYSHTCAVIDIPIMLEFGKIICWGANWVGQLGQGHSENMGWNKQSSDNLKPIQFSDNISATKVITAFMHTCALFKNDKVRCWGRNDEGHLGLGHGREIGALPAEMSQVPYLQLGKYKVKDIKGKGAATCVTIEVRGKTRIKCWGLDVEGNLGLERGHLGSVGLKPNDMGKNLPFLKL